MEARANTLKKGPTKLATKLAVMTILGVFALAAFAYAPAAQAAHIPGNLNPLLAQAIVTGVYDQVQQSGEKYGSEVAGPRDHFDHTCAENCACLSKKFSAALKRNGFHTKTVLLTHSQNQPSIKIRGATPEYGILTEATYDYHMVTIVNLLGGWRVIDPIAMHSAHLEPFKIWRHRILTPTQMSVH